MSRSAGAVAGGDLATWAAVCLSILLMLVMNVVPVGNNDVWILMKVGELIVDTGRIPDTVLFPFTTVRDNHFNAHEWLPSVVYHAFDRLLGELELRSAAAASAQPWRSNRNPATPTLAITPKPQIA